VAGCEEPPGSPKLIDACTYDVAPYIAVVEATQVAVAGCGAVAVFLLLVSFMKA
jgi:hypothetical protein